MGTKEKFKQNNNMKIYFLMESIYKVTNKKLAHAKWEKVEAMPLNSESRWFSAIIIIIQPLEVPVNIIWQEDTLIDIKIEKEEF